MNIKILHMVEDAKEATGITVIIDVFRAFTVEAYLINNGASKIIPVGELQFVYDYKEKKPNCILIGERGGKIIPGFDFGNSPSQIENVDFSGKTILHTTSNGTQGIANAKKAKEILTGSLVNAKAIATYIRKSGIKDVSLVCMGAGKRFQEEDDLCAYYIKSLLDGTTIDVNTEIEKIKQTSGAKFFDEKQKEVFPERDFYLSTELNKFNFVLKVKRDNEGLNYIEKIDVE